MASRTEAGISPRGFVRCDLLVLAALRTAGAFVDGCAVWRDCLCRGRPRSALTAASSILSSARLTGCAARCNCLTGLGVTARVAVRAGSAALLTVRRAFFGVSARPAARAVPCGDPLPRPMCFLDAELMPMVDRTDMASYDRYRDSDTPRTTAARCPPRTF